MGLHFSHYLATVNLHRDFTDAEFVGDLFVEEALGHQGHNFTLADGKGIMAFAKRPSLLRIAMRHFAELDGLPNRGCEPATVERRSGWYSRAHHQSVAVIASEDNRRIGAIGKMLLKAKPTKIR